MPDISVSIGGSNANLQQVLSDTVKRLGGLKSSAASALAPLLKIAAPIAGLVGLGAGFFGVTAAINGTLHKGQELQEEMLRTGQSAGPILKLQAAFRISKIEVDSLAPAINKLQKALAGANEDGEDTSSAFAKLGLNAAALAKTDSATQFAAIGKALAGIQDPAQRTAAVMSIFGKSGGEFLQLFSNPAALSGLTGGLTSSQALMAQNVGLYARITGQIDAFIAKAKSSFGLFAGLTAGLAPLLSQLTNFLPKIDLTSFGKQLGAIPGLLIAAFQTGHLGDLIGLAFEVGIAKAGQLLLALGPLAAKAFEPIRPAVERIILSGGGALVNLITRTLAGVVLAIPPMLTAIWGLIQVLGVGLLQMAQNFIVELHTGLDQAVESLLTKLSKIPGVAKLFGLSDFKPRSPEKIKADNEKEAQDQNDSYAKSATDTTKNATADIGKQFMDGFQNGAVIDDGSDKPAAGGTASDALGALVTQLTAGMGQVAGQIAPPSSTAAPGQPAAPAPGSATKDAKEKTPLDKKDEDDKDDPAKKLAAGPAQTHASSLASIGGGGYGRSGSLASVQQQTNYLKQIAEWTKSQKKAAQGPPLTHLTPGTSNSNTATVS
jgi:hypothetical protein